MIDDDRAYYQYRAEVETELAQQATAPRAVWAHYELAQAYLGKLAPNERDQAEPS